MDSRIEEVVRLLGVVSRYLREDLRPELDQGRHSFLCLVAANLIDSLARDVAQGGEAANAATRRLSALLGAEGEAGDLEADLCRRLASGDMAETTPGLLEHLLETTLDRLAIDQPGYEAYRRERGL